jgi:hypothetical protein
VLHLISNFTVVRVWEFGQLNATDCRSISRVTKTKVVSVVSFSQVTYFSCTYSHHAPLAASGATMQTLIESCNGPRTIHESGRREIERAA